jgi:SAM-dependent methyltransferase
MNSEVIEANQRVHSSLILSGEYQKSPHRSGESVRRVRSILSSLLPSSQSVAHLDVGCGDGFIFECRPSHWVSHGIDVTPEMLQACASNHPEVRLQLGYAESLPFKENSFNVVTCYSFLDHLESTERFYSEAMRVLKPGGVFYFGLSPNREFYVALMRSLQFKLSETLRHQIDLTLESEKAFDDGAYYEKNFGIDKKDLARCEPGKSITLGLSPAEEYSKLERLEVKRIEIKYEWVFQQNRLDENIVSNLINFLPFTSACFKYFDLMGVK